MKWTKEKIEAALPHGSGIDADWRIYQPDDAVFRCYNEFHAMNENGFYVAWLPFAVTVPIETAELGDMEVEFVNGIDAAKEQLEKDGVYIELLQEYLDEAIWYCLYDAIEKEVHGESRH